MNYKDKTLIRGESLYVKVKLYSENSVTGKLEPYDAQELTSILESTKNGELPIMVSEARLSDGKRIPLTIIQELDDGVAVDGELSLYSDIDTRFLPGESFDINIVLKKQMDLGFRDGNDEAVMQDVKSATFNETFYIARSATDIDDPMEEEEIVGGHSVVYLLDGQFYACQNYAEGASIVPLEVNVEEGYSFSGWIGMPETMPNHCVAVNGKTSPSFSIGLLFEDIDENTCRCIGRGSCADNTIVIPPTYNGKTVTQVGRPAVSTNNQTRFGEFEGDSLTSLYLPDTITLIGFRCFAECHNLVDIRFPQNDVFHVMTNAFYRVSLETLTIPANMKVGDVYYTLGIGGTIAIETDTGTNIFGNCDYLTRVVFENGFNFSYKRDSEGNIIQANNRPVLTGQYMFSQCDNLSEVLIPASVTRIPQAVFSYCDNLTEIHFTAQEIDDIEENAFSSKHYSTIMTHVYFDCQNAPVVKYRVGESYSPVTFHYNGSGNGWNVFKTNMERNSSTWGAVIVWVDVSQD